MKLIVFFLFFLSTVTSQELQKVSFVESEKFSGLWYEIARTPNSYQEKCVASSVEYRLISPLKYKVFNRCFDTKIGGELIEYKGYAQPHEGENMASLDMTYFWFFTKTYHIYYLDDLYKYALVADAAFEQVWIMSRKPFMPQAKLDEILTYASKALDAERLIYTPQDTKGR
ncbi:MAG: lipocalin family protein [Sulfurospirillum sp.]|nr:lipocalin family protein [Sulfurospirillum sp.]